MVTGKSKRNIIWKFLKRCTCGSAAWLSSWYDHDASKAAFYSCLLSLNQHLDDYHRQLISTPASILRQWQRLFLFHSWPQARMFFVAQLAFRTNLRTMEIFGSPPLPLKGWQWLESLCIMMSRCSLQQSHQSKSFRCPLVPHQVKMVNSSSFCIVVIMLCPCFCCFIFVVNAILNLILK